MTIKYLPTGVVTTISKEGVITSHYQKEWIEQQHKNWWSTAIKTIIRICTEK